MTTIEPLDENIIVNVALDGGLRLDVHCKDILEGIPGATRSFARKLIDSGHVRVNGKIEKANYVIKKGDSVEILLPEPEAVDIIPQDIPLDIVYQDTDIAVINKPQGMVVHPAAGNPDNTLVNAIMYHIKDLSGIGGELRPGIVHRIDKMTSGLIVIAKNDAAHIDLCSQLKEHSARRTYLCIVNGNIKEDNGRIDIPIGRHPTDRKKMSVQRGNIGGLFREAATNYAVLDRFGQYTLVEAILETGRTHQIRVHMAYINHSVVGDTVYGQSKAQFGLDGQALHAVSLVLVHPRTKEVMHFYAPLPDYFLKALGKIGADVPSIIEMTERKYNNTGEII